MGLLSVHCIDWFYFIFSRLLWDLWRQSSYKSKIYFITVHGNTSIIANLEEN
jgi:hypothetical protein